MIIIITYGYGGGYELRRREGRRTNDSGGLVFQKGDCIFLPEAQGCQIGCQIYPAPNLATLAAAAELSLCDVL